MVNVLIESLRGPLQIPAREAVRRTEYVPRRSIFLQHLVAELKARTERHDIMRRIDGETGPQNNAMSRYVRSTPGYVCQNTILSACIVSSA